MLTVREAAKLSGVSSKILNRWIKDGKLTAHRMGSSQLIDRQELNEALGRESENQIGNTIEENGFSANLRLSEILGNGGIHYGVRGDNKRDAIFNAMSRVKSIETEVSQPLFEMFLAREGMASTGIGDGIAIPHARGSLLGFVKQPVLALAFLEKPIDFGSIDGKPVHALFLLAAPNVKTHLFILSRLSYALMKQQGSGIIASHTSPEDILRFFSEAEADLLHK